MNQKIDKRRNYGIILDTETANTLEEPLFYEIGWMVVDSKGNPYKEKEYINGDIFYGRYELMNTCYYHEKLPEYINRIRANEIEVKNTYEIWREFMNDCHEYNVKFVCAHNMQFDYKATNNTKREITNGKYKYFIPHGVELWDTMRMSEGTICKQKSYIRFCNENGYVYGKNKNVRKTAEIIYRYISGNNDFIESHTALDDVRIERVIFQKCMRQHKKMRKNAFNPKKRVDKATNA